MPFLDTLKERKRVDRTNRSKIPRCLYTITEPTDSLAIFILDLFYSFTLTKLFSSRFLFFFISLSFFCSCNSGFFLSFFFFQVLAPWAKKKLPRLRSQGSTVSCQSRVSLFFIRLHVYRLFLYLVRYMTISLIHTKPSFHLYIFLTLLTFIF